MTRNIAVVTFGCKVNQCDSAALIQSLAERGYRIVPMGGDADLFIVNTCTVTARTDGQVRQLLRRAHRMNPAASIVVTGCYAQAAPDALASFPGVRLVAGNGEKDRIPGWIDHPPEDRVLVTDIGSATRIFSPSLAAFPGHTRAFLKIQDGCHAACSYCIVPAVRGPSRSVAVDEVLRRFETLHKNGYDEMVLTGIHLGAYGRDLDPPVTLLGLARRIRDMRPAARWRLSSLEPGEIPADLVSCLKETPQWCRHLHIPLQSGNDEVLRRMRRPYNGRFFRDLVTTLVQSIPEIAVGVDVMTGFPGETRKAFEDTCALIESLPVAYLHVFPFSPRPGTPAAAMGGQIPDAEKNGRAAALREIGRRKRASFAASFVGRELRVVVETRKDPDTGCPVGISDNYLPVLLHDAAADLRGIARVRPDRFEGGKLHASR